MLTQKSPNGIRAMGFCITVDQTNAKQYKEKKSYLILKLERTLSCAVKLLCREEVAAIRVFSIKELSGFKLL